MDDVTFERRLIWTGKERRDIVAANMGFSSSGSYHYLDYKKEGDTNEDRKT